MQRGGNRDKSEEKGRNGAAEEGGERDKKQKKTGENGNKRYFAIGAPCAKHVTSPH